MAFGRVAKQKAVVEPHLVGGALGTLLRSAAAGEGGEAAAVRTVLSSWMQQQSADEEHFASKAVFVEVRHSQAVGPHGPARMSSTRGGKSYARRGSRGAAARVPSMTCVVNAWVPSFSWRSTSLYDPALL